MKFVSDSGAHTQRYLNNQKQRRNKKLEISGWTYIPVSPQCDPLPRKEFKPVEKRRTAAEQFKEDHERKGGVLEPRSLQQDEDPELHSKTVPEMTHELKKKKSDANVRSVKLRGITFNYDSDCKTCRLVKVYNELKKLNLQPKCCKDARCTGYVSKEIGSKRTHRRRSKRNKVTDIDNRSKTEGNGSSYFIPDQNTSGNRTQVASNRGCQCSHCSPIITLADSVQSISISGKSTASSNTILRILKNRLNQRPNDDNEKRKPARHPSMSSYNSFLSADHEPMVVG